MPLLDHFHQPLRRQMSWESIHSSWATRIADDLNAHWLPSEYVAAEFNKLHGRLEIDVTTYENPDAPMAIVTQNSLWTPHPAAHAVAAVFPDSVEVRVMTKVDGHKVVAVIALVGPSNKDRPAERNAFLAKCAGYLATGASLVVVDIVTEKHFNLHNELARLLEMGPEPELPPVSHLYAVAYRPVLRSGRPEIDIWAETLALGQPLPTLPLRLIEDTFVPVELETTYVESCRRRRLI